MTDRELLELAAKAAGYNAFPSHANQMIESGWNPLNDDGDALRLAVSIGIAIDPREYDLCGVCTVTEDGALFVEDPRSQEPGAATRRAIVRAAAEIGKAMS